MITGQALTELFGSLANELNSASSVAVGILLIAAGAVCLLASRRSSPKQEL
jgi:hypothetical protein